MERNRSYSLAKVPQGSSHKMKPPFLCPWRTEGCTHESDTAAEHHAHLKKHEYRAVACKCCGELVPQSNGTKERIFCSQKCNRDWFNKHWERLTP